MLGKIKFQITIEILKRLFQLTDFFPVLHAVRRKEVLSALLMKVATRVLESKEVEAVYL